jgi:hypothetical protein
MGYLCPHTIVDIKHRIRVYPYLDLNIIYIIGKE